jgi:hypothetical protein
MKQEMPPMNTRDVPEQDVKLTVPIATTRGATPPVSPSLPDIDARLDEALQLTFPASDPVSVSA